MSVSKTRDNHISDDYGCVLLGVPKPSLTCVAPTFITRYGSTLYIGIAMVFVFSPYIRKFSSYFHFQVILTFIVLNV